MKLSRTVSYAITAAAHLATIPRYEVVSNATICEAHQMPDSYVLQIMSLLVTAGIVKSTRGIFGGYQLGKPANKISLLEIIEAVHGPIGGGSEIELSGMSNDSAATVETVLAGITADARERLASITLADLRREKAA